MDAKNIWSVLLDMKSAADSLRSLHNDSEPEDVVAAHAEYDAALVWFNRLVQEPNPSRSQKRYVAIDLDRLNYDEDSAFTSEEEAYEYMEGINTGGEYRLIPVTNYKFFMLFHILDPGFETIEDVEGYIKRNKPGRCLIGEVNCDELMLKAGE